MVIVVTLLGLIISREKMIDASLGIPLIGILAQPGLKSISNLYLPYDDWTYVAKSYIDWIGQTGAISVIVPFDLPQQKLDLLIDNVQGFLIPGGAAVLFDKNNKPTPFQQVVGYILERAKAKNDNGQYYPVMGTCMGFQSMITALMGQDNSAMTSGFNDTNLPHGANKTADFANSKFWPTIDSGLLDRVLEVGYLFFDHDDGFFPKTLLSKPSFTNEMMLTMTTDTESGVEFASAIEHRKYPFFANQFHPEKTLFERITEFEIPRNSDALRLMSDIAFEFVAKVKALSQPIGQVNALVRPFMNIYMEPVRGNQADFEQFYIFPRFQINFEPPSFPHKDNFRVATD